MHIDSGDTHGLVKAARWPACPSHTFFWSRSHQIIEPSAPCTRWFNAWCRHTGFEYAADRQRVTITKPSDPGPTPGPIDNADLLAEEQRPSKSALTEEEAASVSTLRAGLVETRDFWAFAPRTWDLLKQWCERCRGKNWIRVERPSI